MSDERRDQLRAAYEAALDGWLALADELPTEAWATPTGCPGWDAKDQLSHVVSVERSLLGDRDQPPAEVPDDAPHVRNDFGRFVEAGVQARRPMPVEDVIAEARDAFARRRAQLGSLDPSWLDEQVDGPGPGMRMRGAHQLRIRIYDLTTHEYDVRRAVGHLAAAPGAHLPVAIELVVRTWGQVLPRAVDGDAVVGVEVDGAEVARIHLGDGQLFRGDDGPQADAVIGVDVAQLLAIAGGRDDAPTIDQIGARGNLEVVGAVVQAGGFAP